jgi:hypothetical protein
MLHGAIKSASTNGAVAVNLMRGSIPANPLRMRAAPCAEWSGVERAEIFGGWVQAEWLFTAASFSARGATLTGAA